MTSSGENSINILGVDINAINMPLAVNIIDGWIAAKTREYVCLANAHTLMETRRDVYFRSIYHRAGLVTPDGMPLVWLSHWLGFPDVTRVYGPDLMLAVCQHGISREYKHYFLGGAVGVPERLTAALTKRFPGLQVVGAYSPPFYPMTPEERTLMIDAINNAAPDIVWVGLGAPKQDYWMAEHREGIHAPVLIGVGAAFDFHSGVKKQAPRWMRERGLEWFFRLTHEPRRLWKRYLIDNPLFLISLLAQFLKLKEYNQKKEN